MVERTYPHVRVSGSPLERGRQYGEQARQRIEGSLATYARAYQDLAAMTWPQVLALARGYVDAIAAFDERCLEEMRGLAQGAGQDLDAIVAINVRTEIMLSAKAREASVVALPRPPAECTSVAALPCATTSRHTILAQNWDWLTSTTETLVVLEAEQDEGPAFVTVVEAGLLAKAGFNSCGVAVATNALISADDVGEVGVPYHVCLRGLLDAENLPAALATLQRRSRASSANYMLAGRAGLAVDVEARPGGPFGLSLIEPVDGLLVHANHFVGTPGVTDVGVWWMPDSPFRHMRARALLREQGLVTVEGLQAVFSDHANHPVGVCAHADLRDKPMEQGETTASLIMDLDEQVLWLADGNPCTAAYRKLDYAGFFGSGAS